MDKMIKNIKKYHKYCNLRVVFYLSLIIHISLLSLLSLNIACNDKKSKNIEISVEPSSVAQGESVTLKLVTNSPVRAEDVTVDFTPSSGITINNTKHINDTTTHVELYIEPDAAIGDRIVTLDWNSGEAEGDLLVVVGQEQT